MEITIKAVVRYDGTGFAGWQVQPGQRTVQGVLEDTLSTIAGHRIKVEAAGRTDAGVHALGQVIGCRWPERVPLERLRRSVSQMLAPEVRVVSVEPAPDGFHATYHATRKRYGYAICTSREPDPFTARYAWCVGRKMEWEYISNLARRLVGEHDFAGFCASGATSTTSVRTIYSIQVLRGGVVAATDARDLWRIEYEGNGFLYKMVRNITGTLIDIARGAAPEESLHQHLRAPAPFRGHTAPPHGLFLMEVSYSPEDQPRVTVK